MTQPEAGRPASGPRIVLCDDHADVRAAFRVIFESADIEVVGEAADGDAAVALVRRVRPDAALMDVRMPGRDGISATAELAATIPECRVLILTTFDDDDVLFGALGAGASGFVLKNAGPEEIIDAVRRVVSGDAVLDRSVARRVFERFSGDSRARAGQQRSDPGLLERLTERERDVLWLVAQGMTNVEVAERLGVGEATAKTHVSRVLMKLQVRDRVQAVIYAYAIGFATAPRAIA